MPILPYVGDFGEWDETLKPGHTGQFARTVRKKFGHDGPMPLPPDGLEEAAEVLKGIMAEVGQRPKPSLAGDEDAWLGLVAGVTEEVDGLDASGWLCTVAALTIWGPRTQADAASLASYVAEVEGGDPAELTAVFAPVVERWQALEVIDDIGRLTNLGWWGLPEAFVRAWS
jgi:hypothetical protein